MSLTGDLVVASELQDDVWVRWRPIETLSTPNWINDTLALGWDLNNAGVDWAQFHGMFGIHSRSFIVSLFH